MKILDMHAHAFQDRLAEKAAGNLNEYYHIPLAADGHFSHVVRSMEENGITKMVIHTTAARPKHVAQTNRFIAGLTTDDILGFGTLHYGVEDPEAEIALIESLGLRGVKLHPVFQGFLLDDERMFPIYDMLSGRLPVLMHVGDENTDAASPRRLAHLLELFPRLVVIAAHLGGYRQWDEAEEYVIGKNCYLDTSSSIRFLPPERAREMIRRHGAEKVLFGTDYPLSLHKPELGYFDRLSLTDEERELILWKNAYRLLGLEDSDEK